MIKRIAAATALFALSSFAAWDRFPDLEAGKGQAKIGHADEFSTDDDATGYELTLGPQIRYGIIPNLELAAIVPIRLGKDDPTGLHRPIVSARYWTSANVGVYADVALPVGNDDITLNNLGLTLGVQYANQVDAQLSFALEAAYTVEMEKDDQNPGDVLALGGEVDYSLGMAAPYAGLDFYYQGEGEYGPFKTDSDDALSLTLGSGFAVAPSISLDVNATLGLSGMMENYLGLEGSATFSF